ncbi:TlyA family RNA methyltransferase [Candidatus Saccharibacteria bacterium]|nr:TlyA family RNA methyltransferase [Candidatus Saccharibacteria bacterium]
MTKSRLDQEMVNRSLVDTRSQAENYIKLGYVIVDKKIVKKPGTLVSEEQKIKLILREQYVSRAGLKLASVAKTLGVNFNDAVVLDVGSSTGGFTDYALQNGARKVIAVELGTNQMHPKLRKDERIELHEKTDINYVKILSEKPDIVVIDVSFVSLREILPAVNRLSGESAQVIAMVKPQFEAVNVGQKHKGVIKNDRIRRDILKDFEHWVQKLFIICDKADSDVAGSKGNRERFYLLKSV